MNLVEKISLTSEQVFRLGDTNTVPDVIDEIKRTGEVWELEILRIGLSWVRNNLPQEVQHKLQKDFFEALPLAIPNNKEKSNYKILERLGSGRANTVYFLPENESSQAYAIGIMRERIGNPKEVAEFAKEQQAEHAYFVDFFKDVPNLIPPEQNVVYTNYKGEAAVLFIREFVAGDLVDFFSQPQEVIVDIMKRDKAFAEQVTSFTTICMQNKRQLSEMQLDLLGKCNLVIALNEGEARLVLIEAHTRMHSSDDANYAEKVSAIGEKIDKLYSVVSIALAHNEQRLS